MNFANAYDILTTLIVILRVLVLTILSIDSMDSFVRLLDSLLIQAK